MRCSEFAWLINDKAVKCIHNKNLRLVINNYFTLFFLSNGK
ncbi:hypothetical protein [uncultured Gammaproteobacteria bacterium]|nr:hypothetical protein BROOK1789C_418 [Bathymodiolus brooksi thiotrophic gill symbiont]CAC9616563.1 hypothetical protein [uncultured Gammaproteobacteria bacterium]CAC9632818.1 hypothetical protein [uncultured Gammaproteobacteria bacterium]CAC9635791.1 hypothetical protein [uncultured Gammaproteobacteria bacterium]CAC9965100.1 hypothetical protein [uncultured Gammaproteobacteria bacterium]